jgi:hypothetical protein
MSISIARVVTLLCIGVAAQAGTAFAQAKPDVVDAPAAKSDDIIVTGTRETGRTKFTAMSPVDQLSQAAIQGTVTSQLSETLAQLAPSFVVGGVLAHTLMRDVDLAERERTGLAHARDIWAVINAAARAQMSPASVSACDVDWA